MSDRLNKQKTQINFYFYFMVVKLKTVNNICNTTLSNQLKHKNSILQESVFLITNN